ncbi:MAG: Crp/Fnr family transcriptional regulator [Aquabacterium sp.]|uniref:Crp/Fnr family transcriptional regulator n=1 Tax=Aquabacterium sp. TaxID=1872578 RepID=UPI001204734B|nr:Crp/Fnr family transcriptional regulator [Aquabacterium sp.]TAK96898.1 MAG: Crp/Fnr family transcriptional regulator [Aquabacterium sp.]
MVSNQLAHVVNPGSRVDQKDMLAACPACGANLERLIAEDADLAQAWAGLPRRRLEAGQLLAQPGDVAQAVWRVESGLVRTCYLSPDGLERNRSFHLEGQWIGAGSPPRVAVMPYAVEALETTVLTELPYAILTAWGHRADLKDRLTEALAITLHKRDEREASLLMLDASQRYVAFMRTEPALASRVPLHHVASYLGITNVALSRIRRKLKAQGVLPHARG